MSMRSLGIKFSSNAQWNAFHKLTADWEQTREQRKESRGAMAIPLRDRKGQKRWPKVSPKGSRHRGRGTSLQLRSLASVGHDMALGAAGETSPQPKSVLPWALGQESWGRCQDQAPVWHDAGWGWCSSRCLTQPPGDCSPDGGVGREARAPTPRAVVEASAPGLVKEPQVRTGTLSFEGDLCHGLTSLLTARYSKAWLTQRTAGVFWLTQFYQTTQWITDSEQIEKSVSS